MKQLENQRLNAVAQRHSYVDGFNGRLAEYRARTLKKLCMSRRRHRALDLGCGEGLLTPALAKLFRCVVAVDASEDFLRRARAISPSTVRFECSLIEAYRPTQTFDCILLSGVLEHVQRPVAILRRAKEWLTPTGTLIAFVPNAKSLHRRIGKSLGMISDCKQLTALDRKVGHRRYYDRPLLLRHVNAAGFRAVDSGGIFLKPLSNAQMDSWDSRLCDALYEVGRELPDYCAELYVQCVKLA